MKKSYRKFFEEVDSAVLMKNTERLYAHEKRLTFDDWHMSAEETVRILDENGIPGIEKITFPADGRTAYQDKIQPLGWTASQGKLTILSAEGFESGFVAADFERHPFHLVKGSCSTAAGGEVVRIITLEEALRGGDLHDAMVMRNQRHTPKCDELATLLDLGARGVITDFAMNDDVERDGLQWNNAFTERNNWHVTVDDRPFIAYCVSPAVGEKLRTAIEKGPVSARIESDGRRYESTIDVVTALVPGKRREEFWIFAHLYEPLSNDNSAGVACAVETARLIMKKGVPEFSLRLIFGLEHYGFAAYMSHRGDRNMASEVIGGIDYDAMYLRRDWFIHFNVAAAGTPFFGNWILEMLAEDLKGEQGVPEIVFNNSYASMYDDDTFLSDSTTGIPTVWPIRRGKALWHNSLQTMDYLHEDAFRVCCAMNTAFVDAILSPDVSLLVRIPGMIGPDLDREIERAVGSCREHLTRRRDIMRQDLENFARCFDPAVLEPALKVLEREFDSRVESLADCREDTSFKKSLEDIIPGRLTVGFPFDQAKVPASERIGMPGSILYSPMAAMLSNMNGCRSMAEIVRMVEHEICRIIPDEELEKYVTAFKHLCKYGYIEGF